MIIHTFISNYQNSGVDNCLLPIQCDFVIDYGNIDIIDRRIYIFLKFKQSIQIIKYDLHIKMYLKIKIYIFIIFIIFGFRIFTSNDFLLVLFPNYKFLTPPNRN